MSLVGNLEDLSLGDIMQIISLSQKSGVLALDGDAGSGRIVFRSGLVHAASVKGRPNDLRGLLVGGGLVGGPAFDEFAARSRELGLPVEESIAREGGLTSERIDDLLRESVESAILEMFSWPSGDFSFDVRTELEPEDPQLLLTSGINAQFLAMEGMRIRDERSRDGGNVPASPEVTGEPVDAFPSTEAMFGNEPLEIETLLSGQEAELLPLETDDEEFSAADVLVETIVAREDQPPAESATNHLSVVLIEPDVSVLEWVKTSIQADFARVHVFQQAEQGLARIRQYLIRGEPPVVLISTGIVIDPLSGIHGLSDFVARLKTQTSKLAIIGLHECDDGTIPSTSTAFDAVLPRPGNRPLRERGEAVASSAGPELAKALREVLAGRDASPPSSASQDDSVKSASIRDLRDVSERLQDASSRGEILPVVIDFASEVFARVAILIVREDRVFAIAGRGIAALDVRDPLDSSPPVSLQVLDSGWIRQVLESGKPVQGPPATSADRELLSRLGGAEPRTAYLAPIESGGSTIALLYGDQAPGDAAMPDTSGLEVVLQHAGLALDRAALERALREADASES